MGKKGKKTSVKKKTVKAKKKSSSTKKVSGVAAKRGKTAKKSKKNTTKSSSKTKYISAKKRLKLSPSKASKSSKKRAMVKTYLKQGDLEYFRRLLMEKLQEIAGDVDWIENEALRKSRLDSVGNLSTMPIHMADLGTDNYEQEFSLGLMDSERKIVQEILGALKRISLGTYGICEGTGRPIRRARLEANPWARYCVEYASLIEQGKVVEGENYIEIDDDNSIEDDAPEDKMEEIDEEDEEEEDAFDYDDEEDEEEEDGLYYEDDPDGEEDGYY